MAESPEWGEFEIILDDFPSARVHWDAQRAAQRSGSPRLDVLAQAIEAHPDFDLHVSAALTGIDPTNALSRGGNGPGSVHLQLGVPADPDHRRAVLVQEEGSYTWVFPDDPTTGVAELPLDTAPATRGPFSGIMHRILHFITVKGVGELVEHASASLVGRWDETRHPHRLRRWTADDYSIADARSASPDDVAALATHGPVLLVIHGFTGSIHGSFGTFPRDVVRRITDNYGGRSIAFDHPTLARTPEENVAALIDALPHTACTIDVLAHSRGGLVARELARTLHRRPADDAGPTVRSITFVATPNAGTPLADPSRGRDLLDALTNLAGAVPGGETVELVLQLLKDVVVQPVLRGLDGLTAMQPGGPYLTELNHDLLEGVTLRSISADFEPRTDSGFVATARNRLMDLAFGGVRNDLIVPTLSTFVTEGAFTIPPGKRLVLDSSRGVDHSGFWSEPRATTQLEEWIRSDWPDRPEQPVPVAETEVGAELQLPPDPIRLATLAAAVAHVPSAIKDALTEFAGGPIEMLPADPSRPAGKRDQVIVIPGVMGTHLGDDRGPIWIDPLRLANGKFSLLGLADDGKRPADGLGPLRPIGLNRTYAPLVARLSGRYDVDLFPYDWRLDITTSADLLAQRVAELTARRPKGRVHIVAHSMGGLVARAMAARHPRTWEEMPPGSRLVMMGTPNRGSYAMALTLAGEETILKALAAVDVRNNATKILEIIRSFPGVYQMLPSQLHEVDDDHERMYQPDNWSDHASINSTHLTAAQKFHTSLHEVRDPDRLVYVAGQNQSTPFRLELTEPGRFTMGRFVRGDGRVPIELGVLDDVATFYVEASHGSLPPNAAVLDAIDDLLRDGTTSVLADTETVRRDIDGGIEAPTMVESSRFDPEPPISRGTALSVSSWRAAAEVLDAGLRQTLGGGAPAPRRAALEVRVMHASLEQSAYPVAVGHYSGIPAGGAERFLDHKLNGALGRHQRLNDYVETPGSALFIPAPPDRRPRGAIVLGLGRYGDLTTGVLRDAMCRGVVAYALDLDDQAPGTVRQLKVSAVLVGTPGRLGLSVEDAVVSLVEGTAAAIGRLTRSDDVMLEHVELELVELYEQTAEEAGLVLHRLLDLVDPSYVTGVDLNHVPHVAVGGGGRDGAAPRGTSGTPWVRITATLQDADDTAPAAAAAAAIAATVPAAPAAPIDTRTYRTMLFSTLSRGAQSNLLRQDIDLDDVLETVDQAIAEQGVDRDLTHLLYNQLIPQRARFDIDQSDGLQLILDRDLAAIPWELLSARSVSGDEVRLGLRGGMLRQLSNERPTQLGLRPPEDRQVLVIGDPPTSLPRLPGAREEAAQISRLFDAAGWDVNDLVFNDADLPSARTSRRIRAGLSAHSYRAVHIASHGITHPTDPRRVGAVIGPDIGGRLTSVDFAGPGSTPDMVFLNCCHLGQLGPTPIDALRQPHRMAASIAEQLMELGVRAVVVAGWAVDDHAAAAFAHRLYSVMLGGVPFGEAVNQARLRAHEIGGPASNTWGAYQCYGDPDFELSAFGTETRSANTIVSAGQLARQFRVEKVRIGSAPTKAFLASVTETVRQLEQDGATFLDDGNVLVAHADTLAELGDYPAAIAKYEFCLRHHGNFAKLGNIDHMANIMCRLAVQRARGYEGCGLGPDTAAGGTRDAGELFDDAATLLQQIGAISVGAVRSATWGSLYKKRATTVDRDDDERRRADLESALEWYVGAWKLSSERQAVINPYHTNLMLQLRYLTGRRLTKPHQALLERLVKQVQPDPSRTDVDYWAPIQWADTLVTCRLLRYPATLPVVVESDSVAGEHVRRAYEEGFELRSSPFQRDSAILHLDDLADLVGARRGLEFGKIAKDLRAMA